ncbi:hypothetical protein OIU83_21890 [Flavobacterium sp. LS1R49]|uniref:Uncharacterized protein n=1 Tax=Flavobacterium shii TaxID=2987687 RepID=A0A9X3C050_9FLAO|nr:hypothetical protein [Flavobacterium shii]MCV9930326.1 hypothetical protein [Flavobacterium shii]
MSNNALINNTETLLGGWTLYHTLTPEDLQIFKQAMNGLLGVKYNPITVSTQIVAGTNYRFKCNATVILSELDYEALVEIYKPLSGNAVLTGITPI